MPAMRLKTIEIKGFKSFANETVIHFDGDVIGIVGPNGSGKSNIVDAVRWVLGEQKTRELRLDQMSSVIFNGTKKRRPGGMAQVTLTFDNTKNILPTEYQTVSITRILYRSGESEYRLNGVTCRLKDITNLLMDTGIGSNSYAIIALSMVDDILADKDNARQRMFEQAAGISKYKVRKRETINKLNQTTADLDRVEDLLYEIEGNLKTLEKQARRTRRYFELKEQYKTLSLELAAWRTAGLKRKFKSLAGSVQEQEDAFRQIEIEIRQAEAALEAERKANLDKEQLLSTRQRELNSLTGRIRGMEADKRMLQQQARFAEETREKTARQIEEAKGQLARLEEQVASLRERLVEEKRLEAELEEQLDAAEAALKATRDKHGTLKADLDAVLKQQQELERRLFEKEKQKAVWQNQLQSLEQEAQRLAEAEEKSKGEAARLQEQLASLKAEEAQVRAQLEQLEKAEADRQKAIEDTRRKMEALEEERSGINRQLDARRNELQLMRSMVENLEGFPESIR
ncbi:MAG: chromosome segregation protein SMC, partial [Bacteroidetes bacterium]